MEYSHDGGPVGPERAGSVSEESSGQSGLAWYAIYTRSRFEAVVQDGLRGKGYEAFCPFYKARRRRGARNVDVVVPLFPSYVFCRFDASKRLPVLQTVGVTFIISRAGEPEPVDPTEIASLQSIMQSGRPVQPWDFVKAGRRVRIRAGSLAGVEGILLRVKNKSRLVASVTVLQQSVAVEIDQDMLEPIY